MKQLKVILLFWCLLSHGQVQDTPSGLNLYRKSFNIGVGYHQGYGTEDFTQTYQNAYGGYYIYNSGSWRKGLALNFSYNYKIHPNLALGLSAELFNGLRSTLDNQYYNDSSQTITKQTFSYKANSVSVSPHLIFDAPINKNNAIYCKIGYALGSGKMKTTSEETYYSGNSQLEATFKRELTGGMMHGTHFSLGYRAKVDTKVSIFVEINCYAMKQRVREDDLVVATSNGINIMNYIQPYYTKTIFQDQISTSDAPPNLNNPKESLTYNAIYNSIGLQMGLCFHVK